MTATLRAATLLNPRSRRGVLHAEHPDRHKPLCGGGRGGRTAPFQTDLTGNVTCAACLAILHPTPKPTAEPNPA